MVEGKVLFSMEQGVMVHSTQSVEINFSNSNFVLCHHGWFMAALDFTRKGFMKCLRINYTAWCFFKIEQTKSVYQDARLSRNRIVKKTKNKIESIMRIAELS